MTDKTVATVIELLERDIALLNAMASYGPGYFVSAMPAEDAVWGLMTDIGAMRKEKEEQLATLRAASK